MTAPSDKSIRDKALEAETRKKYSGDFYRPDSLVLSPRAGATDYFARLLGIKMDFVKNRGAGKKVLDLCCATGEHLLEAAESFDSGCGLDFSVPLVERARLEAEKRRITNVRFLCGNASELPFPDAAFGLVYSFSALYYVPRLEAALSEIRRVLDRDGLAVFELGNSASLNDMVCKAHGETAKPCHLSPRRMKRAIEKTGLEILEHRAFQILPMWGSKPWFLRPLLGSFWKKTLEKDVGGKMLDERLCALPLLKSLAFRHLFVCRRSPSREA